MSPATEAVLGKMVAVAHGDPGLVIRALGRAGPDLERIVAFIVAHRRALRASEEGE
jgi:hypothetical protein